jgi:hypothetical protein
MRWALVTCLCLLAARMTAAEKWLWLKSPNFDMLSNTGERAAREHLVELEQFRSVFLQFTGVVPEVPLRTTVVLFADEHSFRPYLPQYQGRAKENVAGFFSGDQVNAFMALALGRHQGESKRTIYHEYVHSLYHEIEWQPPTWFNEGSAEVFSTFSVRKGVASLGSAPEWHVGLLRQQRLMSLPQLFSIDTRSPDYNEGVQRGIFYAQSWALAHFLICNRDDAWRQKLADFLGLVNARRRPTIVDFESAMGASAQQMQQRLEDHVYGGGYVIYKVKVEDGGIAQKITSRPATAVEVDCVLGVLRVLSHNSPAAAYELISLQERHPGAVLPHEARAMVALRADNPERAREEMTRAVALNTENTRTHLYLARDLVRRWLTSDISVHKRIGLETAGRLRELLQRILRDNPQAAEVWEALARTEAFAPDPDRATVERVEAHARLQPNEPHALQMLMLAGFARKRLGDEAAARRIAETVDGSANAAKSTKHLNRLLLGDLLAGATGG